MYSVGAAIPFSAAARQANFSTLVAFLRFFGVPAFFNTVAPDIIASNATIRACVPSFSNFGFPAQNGEGENDFADHVLRKVPMPGYPGAPVSKAARQQLVTKYAGIGAMAFNHETMMLHKFLYGLTDHTDTKRTVIGSDGAFGTCIAVASVVEADGRGSMHSHAILFTGPGARFLQMMAGIPELAASFTAYIDAAISSVIPGDLHLQDLLRAVYHGPSYDGPQHVCPNPNAAEQAFLMHVYFAALRTNVHTHGSRCVRARAGNTCAQKYPKSESATTGVRCLNTPAEHVPLDHDRLAVPPRPATDPRGPPFSLDSRCLVVETARPVCEPFPATFTADLPPAPAPCAECAEATALDMCDTCLAQVTDFADQVSQARPDVVAAYDSLMEECPGFNTPHLGPAILVALAQLFDASTAGQLCDADSLSLLFRVLPERLREPVMLAFACRNGKVVQFNPVLTGLRACNNRMLPYWAQRHGLRHDCLRGQVHLQVATEAQHCLACPGVGQAGLRDSAFHGRRRRNGHAAQSTFFDQVAVPLPRAGGTQSWRRRVRSHGLLSGNELAPDQNCQPLRRTRHQNIDAPALDR